MYDIAKGWGHIDCDQTRQIYGKDMFLLRSQLNGVIPVKGDTIYFDVAEGKQGAEACNVRVESQAAGEGSFVGTMKSWNAQKGWGHIECEQTHYLYGKDIFVMRSAIPGGQCLAGDQVSFTIKDGQKGPEAAAVTITSTVAMPFPANISLNMQNKNYIGVVREFNQEKGWGHIACDQTRQLFEKDIFVLQGALQKTHISKGDQVQFNLGMGTKGPEARNIVLLSQPKAFTGQVSRNMGMTVAPKPAGQHRIQQGKGAAPQPGGKRFWGIIKNWNEVKGWGFIACDETMRVYGKDIFLHRVDSGLTGQTIIAGATVQFSATVDGTGRPVATGVNVSGGHQVGKGGAAFRAAPY